MDSCIERLSKPAGLVSKDRLKEYEELIAHLRNNIAPPIERALKLLCNLKQDLLETSKDLDEVRNGAIELWNCLLTSMRIVANQNVLLYLLCKLDASDVKLIEYNTFTISLISKYCLKDEVINNIFAEADNVQLVNALEKNIETIPLKKLAGILHYQIVPQIFSKSVSCNAKLKMIDFVMDRRMGFVLDHLTVEEKKKFCECRFEGYCCVIDYQTVKTIPWSKYYNLLLHYFGNGWLYNRNKLNVILRKITNGFRGEVRDRIGAYECWRSIIDLMTMDATFFKRNIELLQKPLILRMPKKEFIAETHFETFVHLIVKGKCATHMMEFVKSYSRPNALMFQDFISVLLDLLGHEGKSDCMHQKYTKISVGPFLQKGVLSKEIKFFIEHLQICTELASQGVTDGESVIACLWSGFLGALDTMSDEEKKASLIAVRDSIMKLLESSAIDAKQRGVLKNELIAFVHYLKSSDYTSYNHATILFPIFNQICWFSFQDKNCEELLKPVVFDMLEYLIKRKTFFVEVYNLIKRCTSHGMAADIVKYTVKNTTFDKKLVDIYLSTISDLFTWCLTNNVHECWNTILTTTQPVEFRTNLLNILMTYVAENPSKVEVLTICHKFLLTLAPSDDDAFKEITAIMTVILNTPKLDFPEDCDITELMSAMVEAKRKNNFSEEDNCYQCFLLLLSEHQVYDVQKILGEFIDVVKKTKCPSVPASLHDVLKKLQLMLNDTVRVNAKMILSKLEPTKLKSPGVRLGPTSRTAKITNMVKSNGSPTNSLQLFSITNSSSPSTEHLRGSMLSKDVKKSTPNNNAKTRKIKRIDVNELSDKDFVVIDKKVEVDVNKLSDHQKEAAARRREDIPAMYEDLTQSSMDRIQLISQESSASDVLPTDVISQEKSFAKLNGCQGGSDKKSKAKPASLPNLKKNETETKANQLVKDVEMIDYMKKKVLDITSNKKFYSNEDTNVVNNADVKPKETSDQKNGKDDVAKVEKPFQEARKSLRPIKLFEKNVPHENGGAKNGPDSLEKSTEMDGENDEEVNNIIMRRRKLNGNSPKELNDNSPKEMNGNSPKELRPRGRKSKVQEPESDEFKVNVGSEPHAIRTYGRKSKSPNNDKTNSSENIDYENKKDAVNKPSEERCDTPTMNKRTLRVLKGLAMDIVDAEKYNVSEPRKRSTRKKSIDGEVSTPTRKGRQQHSSPDLNSSKENKVGTKITDTPSTRAKTLRLSTKHESQKSDSVSSTNTSPKGENQMPVLLPTPENQRTNSVINSKLMPELEPVEKLANGPSVTTEAKVDSPVKCTKINDEQNTSLKDNISVLQTLVSNTLLKESEDIIESTEDISELTPSTKNVVETTEPLILSLEPSEATDVKKSDEPFKSSSPVKVKPNTSDSTTLVDTETLLESPKKTTIDISNASTESVEDESFIDLALSDTETVILTSNLDTQEVVIAPEAGSPTASPEKLKLDGSPVTRDTPTRKTELLNSTFDISPIKVALVKQQVSPDIFGSQPEVPPSNAPLKDDKEAPVQEKITENETVAIPLMKRSWLFTPSDLNRISKVVTDSRPVGTSSPKTDRVRKMMLNCEEQKFESVLNAPEEVKMEYLTMNSRPLPDPNYTPTRSNLKRKLPDTIEEGASPMPKKKRKVGFHDPPHTCVKYIKYEEEYFQFKKVKKGKHAPKTLDPTAIAMHELTTNGIINQKELEAETLKNMNLLNHFAIEEDANKEALDGTSDINSNNADLAKKLEDDGYAKYLTSNKLLVDIQKENVDSENISTNKSLTKDYNDAAPPNIPNYGEIIKCIEERFQCSMGKKRRRSSETTEECATNGDNRDERMAGCLTKVNLLSQFDAEEQIDNDGLPVLDIMTDISSNKDDAVNECKNNADNSDPMYIMADKLLADFLKSLKSTIPIPQRQFTQLLEKHYRIEKRGA